jgi:hypothetical protein
MLILPYHINTIENRRETIPVVFKNQPYDPVQCSVVFRYPFFSALFLVRVRAMVFFGTSNDIFCAAIYLLFC